MPALVIDGHPNSASLTAALSRAYADAHGAADVLAVRDLDFDPVLHRGLTGRQPLEPALEHAAARIAAADHIVIATPVWWGSIPAPLKGFFDRVLARRWAYSYRGRLPVGHLGGRSGRLIVTSDSPRFYLSLVGDTTVRQVRGTTMRFVGMRPVRVSRFTSVRTSTDARRQAWLARVARDARRDAAWTAKHHPTPSDPGPLPQ